MRATRAAAIEGGCEGGGGGFKVEGEREGEGEDLFGGGGIKNVSEVMFVPAFLRDCRLGWGLPGPGVAGSTAGYY